MERVKPHKTYALLDCHSVCHAAKHKTKRLTFGGYNTGVIFGFLRTLLKLQEDLRPDIWVFAWDSKASVRREAYPDYKLDRLEKSPEELKLNALVAPQFDILRDEVLPELGFANVFRVDGFEADDIIAQAIRLGPLGDRYIMVTRDNDMLQLLSDDVIMYDHVNNGYYTKENFISDWGIQPRQWVIVKAIAGCSTDNVKGIHGIGEKTAAKMLAGQLGEHTKAFKAIMDKGNQDMAQRNVHLVALPHHAMPALNVSTWRDSFNLRGFGEICMAFGMESMIRDANWHRWKEAFSAGVQ